MLPKETARTLMSKDHVMAVGGRESRMEDRKRWSWELALEVAKSEGLPTCKCPIYKAFNNTLLSDS